MSHSITIVRKEDQKTTEWWGGSTTQLAIYPENAEYHARNFKWRISTAKIKEENSVFTKLSSYWRLLMVTDGEITLDHQDQHTIRLRPFEQDSFSGEWTTKCLGRGEDINVMLAPGYKGELNVISIVDSRYESLQHNKVFQYTQNYQCIFIKQGSVTVSINSQESMFLNKGDLLVCNNHDNECPIHVTYKNLDQHRDRKANIIRIGIYHEKKDNF